MIKDLRGSGAKTVSADVAVVGGGTVGLLTAVLLCRQGLSVVCLESGDKRQAGDTHPLNEVVQTRGRYAGAQDGRFRCLGGTSTRWGGAMIPFLERDIADAGWPLLRSDFIAQLQEVERNFGLPDGPYECKDFFAQGGADFVARYAKWPPFGNRNVFNLLRKEVSSALGPEVWINATVTEFELNTGLLKHIVAQSLDGSTLRVSCGEFILAAGAIESTRLLMILNLQNGHGSDRSHEVLGRYFHDHLSAPIAELNVGDKSRFNRLFGFQFSRGGTMRNLRFEMSETTPLRQTVPPCFAHVAVEEDTEGGGFDALRSIYRRIQQRRLPSLASMAQLFAATPWLTRAMYWRCIEHRLLYPDDARLRVHMVIEQSANSENRISLSRERVDPFGLPMAEIAWDVHPGDYEAMYRAVNAFEKTWNSSKLSTLANFTRLSRESVETDMLFGGGIYHPVGSTRMGTSPETAVVDEELRVFRVPNLRVLSTSVLPTAGGANPTMMLLMLAIRCVEQVAGYHSSNPLRRNALAVA